LPKAKTGQTQMREMLIVSIDDFGQTYLDQVPVNYEQLDQNLKSFQSKNPGGLMVLYAPQNARYAKVVEVLDKLREVGGDRVALATLPSSAPSPLPNPSLPNSGIPAAPSIGNSGLPLPSPVAPGQQLNPNQFPSPLPDPRQQEFNPNQLQSPLPAPRQPSNVGVNQGIPPVSPTPAAPNSRPRAATAP
jgi:biopolymer transport protein ExbD